MTAHDDPRAMTWPGRPIDVTPSDSTTYSPPLRGFRVYTTAGDVYVTDELDNTVKIGAVALNEFIPGICKKIRETNTVAAGFTGFY